MEKSIENLYEEIIINSTLIILKTRKFNGLFLDTEKVSLKEELNDVCMDYLFRIFLIASNIKGNDVDSRRLFLEFLKREFKEFNNEDISDR